MLCPPVGAARACAHSLTWLHHSWGHAKEWVIRSVVLAAQLTTWGCRRADVNAAGFVIELSCWGRLAPACKLLECLRVAGARESIRAAAILVCQLRSRLAGRWLVVMLQRGNVAYCGWWFALCASSSGRHQGPCAFLTTEMLRGKWEAGEHAVVFFGDEPGGCTNGTI